MSLNSYYENVVQDAINSGVKYSLDFDGSDIYVDVDYDGLESYLIKQHGESVGNILSASLENYDIEGYIASIYKEAA